MPRALEGVVGVRGTWVAAFCDERSESIAATITFGTFAVQSLNVSQRTQSTGAWQVEAIAGMFAKMDAAWKRLYALVKRIPKGRVTTYGHLARAVRLPGGARAAGRAMAACPRGQAIPWHRVVAAGGRIAVREPFASLQRKLLEAEGTRLIERRVALSDHLWAIPRPRRPSRKPKPRTRRRK
jgi:methylated-DNA-protein-cysteine methyltransferase-like protein